MADGFGVELLELRIVQMRTLEGKNGTMYVKVERWKKLGRIVVALTSLGRVPWPLSSHPSVVPGKGAMIKGTDD